MLILNIIYLLHHMEDIRLIKTGLFQKGIPDELIYIILNCIHYPQPINLQKDIISFQSLKYVFEYYYDFWIVKHNGYPNADLHWIENDIIFYVNEYHPTGRGLQPKMSQILDRRCFVFEYKKEKFYNFILKCNKPDIKHKQIVNILWGLMLPNERSEFSGYISGYAI